MAEQQKAGPGKTIISAFLFILIFFYLPSRCSSPKGVPTSAPAEKREDAPANWDELTAKVYCGSILKKQMLNDPDSYVFESAEVTSSDGPYGTATIYYRARNGFGGYVRSSASCRAYDNAGKIRYEVSKE